MEIVLGLVLGVVLSGVGVVTGCVLAVLAWPFMEAALDRAQGYPHGRRIDGDVLDHMAAWWHARRWRGTAPR